MITLNDSDIHVRLKTTAETRKAIVNEMQELNQAECKARATFLYEMQRIEDRRDVLEEAWRKTYAD